MEVARSRRYVEVGLVMPLGMGVLAVPARLATSAVWPGINVDDPGLSTWGCSRPCSW